MHSEQWKLPAIVYDDAFQDGFLQCTVELLWLEHLWNHVDIMQQLLQCTVELLWLEHLWNHVDINAAAFTMYSRTSMARTPVKP